MHCVWTSYPLRAPALWYPPAQLRPQTLEVEVEVVYTVERGEHDKTRRKPPDSATAPDVDRCTETPITDIVTKVANDNCAAWLVACCSLVDNCTTYMVWKAAVEGGQVTWNLLDSDELSDRIIGHALMCNPEVHPVAVWKCEGDSKYTTAPVTGIKWHVQPKPAVNASFADLV